MRRFRTLLIALPALLLSSFSAPQAQAAEFRSGDSVSVKDTIGSDLFAAGNTFSLDAPLAGELFAAGQTVGINEVPARSAFLAGDKVTVKGVGYNLFGAGRDITLSGPYGHDVYVAGGNITLDENTVITGDLWITGTNISLNGEIGGTVHVYGENVTSKAEIAGSLVGDAAKLSFEGGSIGGSLNYRSKADAEGLSKVSIAGGTNRSALPDKKDNVVGDSFMLMLSALLLGALLAFRLPSRVRSVVASAEDSYAANAGAAALFLIAAPILAGLFLATIIGWKVSLALLLFAGLAILLAGVIGLFFIGRYVLGQIAPQHRDNIWYQLVVGALLGYLIRIVPVVGPVASILLFLLVFLPVLGAMLRSALSKN